MSAQSSASFLNKHATSLSTQNTPAANQVITRTLCVHIEGSLTDLAKRGPLAALWKGASGRENVMFHPNLEENMNPEQSTEIVNSLRSGVIKKVVLKEHQSTFPYILGVDINCIPPNEVTSLGEKFAYTVLPNSLISVPQTVYMCDNATQENSAWNSMYSAWNNSNLETHGVMDVPNQSFLFVHMDHPVIGLLRYNQNMIGCDIDAQPKLEKEYFKVSKQVMATCCETIRQDVLSKMKTRDMNMFTLQLRRLNGTPWDEVDHTTLLGFKGDLSLSEEERNAQKQQHMKDFMTRPYQYVARLEVEYEIPCDLMRNHVDSTPSYLPNMDPGRYGGGTYTGQSMEPTIEAYENIFGPSARDIKNDLQRYKRHGRWHLPDILKGPNTYLTDRVDGLITDATNSPFTSRILPYKYMEQPDGKIKWNVWSFDEGLASRVPYESAARTLTQSKKSYSGYMVRQGMAIVLEHNFMMSEAGRLNFKRQLSQLVGSIQLTNDLDVHVALIVAPSHQKEMREKYFEQDKSSAQICRDFIDLFGFAQKNQNAMDILIEEAKTQLKLWGSPMPNFLLCNSKLTFQLTMTPDRTNYVTNGSEGQKRLRAGPDLPSYRGIDIMHTRAFSMETGAPPRDILRRRVRVAEYYRIKPHKDNWKRQFQFYNEERDMWFTLSWKELLQYAKNNGPQHRDLLDITLPGGDNHERIDKVLMELGKNASKALESHPITLGVPMEVAGTDPRYEMLKNVYVQILNGNIPEYSYNVQEISPGTVYVPGCVAILKKNLMDASLSLKDIGKVNNFDVLPKPIQDAFRMISPEKMNSLDKKILWLIVESVQTYPRTLNDIGPLYFIKRDSPYLDFFSSFQLDVLQNFFNNIPHSNDQSKFQRALALRNYNRYGIPTAWCNKQPAYVTETKYNEALSLPVTSAGLVNGSLNANCTFKQGLGAFFCPNHFKWDTDKISHTFGQIVGNNLIFNSDLVNLLTRIKDDKSTITPSLQDNMYEHTFLYDILNDSTKHEKYLDKIVDALKNLQSSWKNPATKLNRAQLTLQFIFNESGFKETRRQDANFGKNRSLFFAATSDYATSQKYTIDSAEKTITYYWYFNKCNSTAEEILANYAPSAPLAPTSNATFKQFMWSIGLHNDQNFFFPAPILGFFGTEEFCNQQFMSPHERNTNFLSKPINIQDLLLTTEISRNDALDFLQICLSRLFGDQELQPPPHWRAYVNRPLDIIRRNPMLPKLHVPMGPPTLPRHVSGMGAELAPNGSEHIELVVVRPNIEHFMLGMIMGFGGESLGNTFWGQTELSCYDDSMHGIWGMSYKYHSRATVVNFKNLVRLWDIAYDGYVGGKDDSYVKWTDENDVRQFIDHSMDVTKNYRGKSMMVMAFDHSDRAIQPDLYETQWKPNWPSPIVFYDDPGKQQNRLPLDPDQIYVTDTSAFHVFNSDIYKNAYGVYKDLMPDFYQLHKVRKNAALGAIENEVSTDSLAFQGTMNICDSQGHVIEQILGSGHHGPDFVGVASLRAGKGYKFSSQPTMQRLV